jgi:hypothetical protein
MADTPSPPPLSESDIRAAVAERLEKYRGLDFLQSFGLFMGMAQLLEVALKRLLQRKYGLDPDDIDRWTLGRTAFELRARGMRPDFCTYLDSVVGYRNHAAHGLLAQQIVFRSVLRDAPSRLNPRELDKGIYELEQLTVLYDWCEELANILSAKTMLLETQPSRSPSPRL